MKGWGHFTISLLLLFLFIPFIILFVSEKIIFDGGGLFIFMSVFLFLAGSLLPDSDSNNKGSLIFVFNRAVSKKIYKNKEEDAGKFFLLLLGFFLYPIAFITSQLEKIIIKYTKRERGHRESLHTLFGIIITSLFWGIVFNIVYFSITKSQDYIIIPFFPLILFVSQFLHLIEDLQKGWKITWK